MKVKTETTFYLIITNEKLCEENIHSLFEALRPLKNKNFHVNMSCLLPSKHHIGWRHFRRQLLICTQIEENVN